MLFLTLLLEKKLPTRGGISQSLNPTDVRPAESPSSTSLRFTVPRRIWVSVPVRCKGRVLSDSQRHMGGELAAQVVLRHDLKLPGLGVRNVSWEDGNDREMLMNHDEPPSVYQQIGGDLPYTECVNSCIHHECFSQSAVPETSGSSRPRRNRGWWRMALFHRKKRDRARWVAAPFTGLGRGQICRKWDIIVGFSDVFCMTWLMMIKNG